MVKITIKEMWEDEKPELLPGGKRGPGGFPYFDDMFTSEEKDFGKNWVLPGFFFCSDFDRVANSNDAKCFGAFGKRPGCSCTSHHECIGSCVGGTCELGTRYPFRCAALDTSNGGLYFNGDAENKRFMVSRYVLPSSDTTFEIRLRQNDVCSDHFMLLSDSEYPLHTMNWNFGRVKGLNSEKYPDSKVIKIAFNCEDLEIYDENADALGTMRCPSRGSRTLRVRMLRQSIEITATNCGCDTGLADCRKGGTEAVMTISNPYFSNQKTPLVKFGIGASQDVPVPEGQRGIYGNQYYSKFERVTAWSYHTGFAEVEVHGIASQSPASTAFLDVASGSHLRHKKQTKALLRGQSSPLRVPNNKQE